jgi:hypothetical protein
MATTPYSTTTGVVYVIGSLPTTPVTLGGTGTQTQFTQGSVVFAGANGIYAQDNANFTYNAGTGVLALLASTAAVRLGTSPAVTGRLQYSYGGGAVTRNRTNDGDVGILGMGGFADDDYLEIGDNQQHGVSKPLGIKFYPGSATKLQLDTNGAMTLSGTLDATAYKVATVAGIDASVTTGSLVGKTMTFSKGILTGFA